MAFPGARRVAITGIGCVTPIGIGVDEYWSASVAGKNGIGPIEHFDAAAFSTRFSGFCKGFEPSRWLEHKAAKNSDRFVHLAVAAADMALEDAGVRPKEEKDPARFGAIVGSGIGGIHEIYEQTKRLVERGPDRVSPFFVPKMMLNAASGNLAIRYGISGPNFATASACAASSHAIGTALLMIRAGMADIMIAGGSEAATNELGLAAFCAARALSTRNDDPARACRPFDKERDGFVMGEGAGIVVLEELERAKARGARIYAELVGFGASDDAHHITAPEPEGLGATRAMRLALEDARLAPQDVQLVSAHGTSTPLGDVAETKAIKAVFGDHAKALKVTASKSQIGHLLGAAGVMGLVQALLALRNGVAPPTINYATPDPECDLDCVPNEARKVDVRAAIANSFGFGGHNATLAVRRV
ncbi:MAG TPA: beta-ketoacyl-ACP synthase II [Planctomycetota bacterium]|nr:beta-ketoacyl-ACP synthase II [Planctomycetota bacterium]